MRKKRQRRGPQGVSRIPIRKLKKKNSKTALEVEVLALLAGRRTPLSLTALWQKLRLPPKEEQLLQVLDNLRSQGRITDKGKKGYVLAKPASELRAVLDLTAKGFGFAMVEGEAKGKKDVFIPQANLGGASHGDVILVRIIKEERGRREGVITQVIKRAFTQICGIYEVNNLGGTVLPDNDRLPYAVTIAKGDNLAQAADGQAVVVDIVDYGSAGQEPQGKIVEILGDPWDVHVQVEMAMRSFSLAGGFPQEVLHEAESLNECVSCEEGREDLRHLPFVTIDGKDARDFDDAICVLKKGKSYQLYVAIADVSWYVLPGSAIDREAYRRGTSVYLPDRVLPMLPERLSNSLCSLVPEQDRPTFTAILTFDHRGKRTGERFVKSMIRSQKRFTYTLVQEMLFAGDAGLREQYAAFVPMLEAAQALVSLLKKNRAARGGLEFNAPETEIVLENDRIVDMHPAPRNQAHMLIEDCMLAANEAVAETVAKAQRKVLYRIHELPDPAKLEAFTDMAKVLALDLPKPEVEAQWFAQVLERTKHSPAAYVVNNLLLRTMQQARYSAENVGHFGLGADYYLHFTSPIRRYPDLIAHRVLQGFLAGKRQTSAEDEHLPEAGQYLSQRERQAIDVERNCQSRLAVLYLRERIGDAFAAIISGVGAMGLYIELDGTGISGFIPIASLQDDYYLYDGRRHRLLGERSNVIHQLGDRILARLEETNLLAKRLIFSLQEKAKKGEGN